MCLELQNTNYQSIVCKIELDEPKLYSPRVYCIYILQTFQCNLKILVAAIRVYNTIHSAIPIYHLSLFLTIIHVENHKNRERTIAMEKAINEFTLKKESEKWSF